MGNKDDYILYLFSFLTITFYHYLVWLSARTHFIALHLSLPGLSTSSVCYDFKG